MNGNKKVDAVANGIRIKKQYIPPPSGLGGHHKNVIEQVLDPNLIKFSGSWHVQSDEVVGSY